MLETNFHNKVKKEREREIYKLSAIQEKACALCLGGKRENTCSMTLCDLSPSIATF